MPATIADYPRVELQLEEVFRGLPRRSGLCISGRRSEYLIALTHRFLDPRAARVMPMYDAFGSDAASAVFPPWFYLVWGAGRLVPLVKAPPPPGQEPDARPIVVSSPDLGAILRAVVQPASSASAAYLRPQQVSVGVSGGISIVVHGLSLLLELRPSFVIVRVDLKNAYNETCRAAMFRRVARSGVLGAAVPLMQRLRGPEGLLYMRGPGGARRLFEALGEALGVDFDRGDSSDGTGQGQAPSCTEFCVAIHDEVRALDAELRVFGGCARFISDDGYAAGPAHVVFDAVARFARRVSELLALHMQWHKLTCFSRGYDLTECPHRLRYGVPIGVLTPMDVDADLRHEVERLPAALQPDLYVPPELSARGEGRGIMVGGVPLGDAQFVSLALWRRVSSTVSAIRHTTSQLREAPHHVWALLSLCHSCEFDYWLRHLPPDVTGPFAARIDDAILEAFEGLTYRGAITDHPYWIQLLQRMRLPPRRHGCGLRSRVELAPVAYASGLVEAVEEMLGPDGFFPMLGPLFGVDEGRPLVQGDRFAVFTGRASGAGEALEACWRAMQDEFDEIPGGGLLSDPVSRAGLGRVGRMQHLLTDQLEERREAHLHRTMLSLSADDGESRYIRQAWLQADRFSMQWASSYPSEDWAIPAALFPIGVCIIMGLPLDALRHRVGVPIPCSAPASAARRAPHRRVWWAALSCHAAWRSVAHLPRRLRARAA